MRPQRSNYRAAGHAKTNGSSIPGGIFGVEPTFYQQAGLSPEEDFMTKLEAAEGRDLLTAQELRQNTGQEYQSTLQRQRGSNIVFGDDSSPPRHGNGRGGASQWQTTNQMQQDQMQRMHEKALERREEQILMQIMMEQHGMTEKDAKFEIALYRKEQAAAEAAGHTVPRAQQQQPPPARGLQPNGRMVNAHLAQQRQPQPQHWMPPAAQAPQPQAAWPRQVQPSRASDNEAAAGGILRQQQRTESGTPFPVVKHYNSPGDMAAGGRNHSHSGEPRRREGGGRANQSAVEGGIFAPGVWS